MKQLSQNIQNPFPKFCFMEIRYRSFPGADFTRLHLDFILYRWGDDKAPGAVFRDTLDVALVGQLFQVLVDSCHIDTHLIRKALDSNVRGLINEVENPACGIATELHPLSVKPPHVVAPFGKETDVVCHLFHKHVLEPGQELLYLPLGGVSPERRDRTHGKVSAVESFKILIRLAAADNHHRISVARQDVIGHQARDASVAILEGMYAYVAVMEDGGKFHRRETA